MTRSLTVWWDREIVGRLALDRRGAMRFTLGPPFLRRRVAELCSVVSEVCDAVAQEFALPGLSEEALAAQSGLVRARPSRLAATV